MKSDERSVDLSSTLSTRIAFSVAQEGHTQQQPAANLVRGRSSVSIRVLQRRQYLGGGRILASLRYWSQYATYMNATPLNPIHLQPSPTQPPLPLQQPPSQPPPSATGAGPSLTLPVLAAPQSQPSPQSQSPPQSQPAPLSQPAPYSRTDVLQSCIDLYQKIRLTVMDPRERHTIKGALAKHGVTEQMFRRRRWIAELAVLDHPRLLDLMKKEMHGNSGRVKLEALNDAANRAIKTIRHLKEARAAAISCGRLM